jgi:hypothetical protein
MLGQFCRINLAGRNSKDNPKTACPRRFGLKVHHLSMAKMDDVSKENPGAMEEVMVALFK